MLAISHERARLYHKYRLPYAEGTAEAILNLTGLSKHAVVVELGSGTGILTRQFLKHCTRIYAVEPEASFREIAEAGIGTNTAFKSVMGFSEDTGLEKESCNLAVAANALHRFSLNKTLTELNRILRRPRILVSIGYRFQKPKLMELLQPYLEKLPNWKARFEKSIFTSDESMFFKPGSMREISITSEHEETIEEFMGAALSGIEAPAPGDREYEAFIEAHKCAFENVAQGKKWHFTYETVIKWGEVK